MKKKNFAEVIEKVVTTYDVECCADCLEEQEQCCFSLIETTIDEDTYDRMSSTECVYRSRKGKCNNDNAITWHIASKKKKNRRVK